MNSRALWGFIAVFAAVTLLARVAPYVPNMAPVAAFALFLGVNARSRWAWLLVPAVLTLSNWFLGFYHPGVMAAVYGCFVLTVLIGVFARKYPRLLAVTGGSIAGSTMFFVVTNLAVWAFSGMYAPTTEGLILCYVLAVPFFGFTLAGDLVWNAVFFGSWGAYLRWRRRVRLPVPSAAEAAN